MTATSYRFVVSGRVQGVGFRQATRMAALELGLRGWVRNRADGRVEGLVGDAGRAALERFRSFLNGGPRLAEVDELQWIEADEEVAGDGFEIRA